MSIFCVLFYLYNIWYVQATAIFFSFFSSFPFCGRFQVEFGFQTGLAQSVVSLTAHRFASLTIIIDFLLKLLLFGLLVACYACIYIYM